MALGLAGLWGDGRGGGVINTNRFETLSLRNVRGSFIYIFSCGWGLDEGQGHGEMHRNTQVENVVQSSKGSGVGGEVRVALRGECL